MPIERRFAVETAGFWYRAAEKAKGQGNWAEAYLCMVNAFNHTENALYAARRGLLDLIASPRRDNQTKPPSAAKRKQPRK